MTSSATYKVSVSFGGTKLALGLLSPTSSLLAKTERVEWRDHPAWKKDDPLVSLLDLVARQAQGLLQSMNVDISDVATIGLAWPGPGVYKEGLLRATFIPQLERPQDIHTILYQRFRETFGPAVAHVRIRSRLDAVARAWGELRTHNGGFHNPEGAPIDGLLINIATGVAGAIVEGGAVVEVHRTLGETYGQWGRYLIKGSSGWSWRPTADGSIPEFDRRSEVRFTDLCGGPALFKRWARNGPAPRDVNTEKETLIGITDEAYRHVGKCRHFVRVVGKEVGSAIACVVSAFFPEGFCERVVLTGGIGENFGRPLTPGQRLDFFLDTVSEELAGFARKVTRTRLGLDAELIGAA